MQDLSAEYDVRYKDYNLGRIKMQITAATISRTPSGSWHRPGTGYSLEHIQNGLREFNGVYRRFELKGEVESSQFMMITPIIPQK